MKAWSKYALLAVVLLALSGSWFVWGVSVKEAVAMGLWGFAVYIFMTCVAAVSALFGACILYELSEIWYQQISNGSSWVYDAYNKFKSWLGRDGIK